MRCATILAALALSGCAGVPVGHRTYVVLGVGVVRIDRAAKATGVSSTSLGLTVGCRMLTLGAQASYCASVPIDGDVAIIERASGPDQHLAVQPLHPRRPSQ